jgi:hypothetical protein
MERKRTMLSPQMEDSLRCYNDDCPTARAGNGLSMGFNVEAVENSKENNRDRGTPNGTKH